MESLVFRELWLENLKVAILVIFRVHSMFEKPILRILLSNIRLYIELKIIIPFYLFLGISDDKFILTGSRVLDYEAIHNIFNNTNKICNFAN